MFSAGHIIKRTHHPGEHRSLPDSLFLRPRRPPDTKFRWYVPFLWQPFLGSLVGLAVTLGGAGLCVAAYKDEVSEAKSGQHNGTREDRGTTTSSRRSPAEWPAQSSPLLYLGPSLMGLGCFACVFACVSVCEARDKVLRLMDANERAGLPTKANLKVNFYDLVLKERYYQKPNTNKDVGSFVSRPSICLLDADLRDAARRSRCSVVTSPARDVSDDFKLENDVTMVHGNSDACQRLCASGLRARLCGRLPVQSATNFCEKPIDCAGLGQTLLADGTMRRAWDLTGKGEEARTQESWRNGLSSGVRKCAGVERCGVVQRNSCPSVLVSSTGLEA